MRRFTAWLLALCCACLGASAMAQSHFALTDHTFQGTEGAQPQAVAATPDGSVYGISENGGTGFGTLLRYAGGTVTAVHDFNGSDGGMKLPSCCNDSALASLIATPSGDLYGYTLTGGNKACQSGYGCGVIFHYSPAAGYSVLWKFTGGTDGGSPSALLMAADGNLYGTSIGSPTSYGAVFKLTTGGVLTVLHAFCSSPGCADGDSPDGLAQGNDGNFYGHYYGNGGPDYIYRITSAGVITPLVSLLPAIGNNWGTNAGNFVTGSDGGIYFTFGADNYGSGRLDRFDIGSHVLRMVHQFDYTDGDPPYRLTVGTDGTIYGTAVGGGKQGLGTTFQLIAPSTLTFLYDFQGQLDGASPTGLTQLANGQVFGVAAAGGVTPGSTACVGCGTLYQLLTVPAAAPIIASFNPGSGPLGTAVTVTGAQFTGTVGLQFGGASSGFNVQGDQLLTTNVPSAVPALAQLGITNAAGTGFAVEPFQLSNYQYSTIYSFCPGSPYPYCGDGAGPVGLMQSSDGNFYGTTAFNYPSSVLFKVTPAGVESVLAANLNIPNPIIESGSYLYGTSQSGGFYGSFTGCNDSENPTGCGTVFRVNKSNGKVQTLYKFKGLSDGSRPRTGLVTTATNVFFGSTPSTLFQLHGSLLQTVHTFAPATDGNAPAMVLAGQDGNVYGVNTQGGAGNLGTVFVYKPSTSTYQVLHSFAAGEGSKPIALVRSSDGVLYGVTQAGGTTGTGSVFRIDTAGVYSTLYSFPGAAGLGSAPGGLVLGKDGALYGFTEAGAVLGGGAVFRMATDGSAGTLVYSFFPSNTASVHGYGPTALLQAANGDWYGTAYDGGATTCAYGEGCGAVFHIH